MKKYLPLFVLLFLLSNCSQHTNKPAAADTARDSTVAAANFIPVTAILQNQVAALDSLPVTILQVTTINKKDDSAWLPVTAVKPLLTPFMWPMIDKKNLVALFKESRFNDESTAAITFTYDPIGALPDTVSLRHWDVYFDPEQNAIRRVYMVKQVMVNNMPATQQLTWQTGKWAKIVTINNDKNAVQPILSEVKWVWDLNE